MAQDHSTQHIGTIATTARDNGMPGKTAHGGCNACDRRGLTFLPVRYAVGDLRDVRAYTLPSDKVAAFTTLTLDKGIDKDGNEVARPPVSGYLLRKLRKGYLYVYDAHPLTPGWQCFAVSEYGELKGFPMDNPTPLADITPMSDCPHGTGHPARASLVLLPDAKTSRPVHLMFLEIPLGPTRLTQIAQDKVWRDAHMQSFKVGNEAGSPHHFAQAAIPHHVPEYDDDNAFLYRTLEHQLWPGRHSDMHASLAAKRSQLDAFAQLSAHMDEIHRTGQVKAAPFMFAMKDEVGIIEQLNALRVLPLERFQAALAQEDDRQDRHSKPVLNQRNYRWYVAVKQLHELMEQMPVRGVEIDKDFKPPYFTRTYQEAMEHAAEGASSPTVSARYIEQHPDLLNEAKHRVHSTYQAAFDKQRAEEIDTRDKAQHQLGKYYRKPQWQVLHTQVKAHTDDIETLTPAYDADYALWVYHHLNASVSRYAPDSLYHGGYITKLLSDTLQYGIQGEASRWLWQQLSQFKDTGQVLLKGYTFNHPEMLGDMHSELVLEKGSTYLDDVLKFGKDAGKLGGMFGKLIEKYKKKGAYEALVFGQGAFAVFKDALTKLHEINIHTQISLLSSHLRAGDYTSIDIVGTAASRNIRNLHAYQGIAQSIHNALEGHGGAPLHLKSYQLTLGELAYATEYMNQRVGGIADNAHMQGAYKFNEVNGVGGNFANVKHASTLPVTFTVVVGNDEAQALDKAYKARQPVVLDDTLATWHREHQEMFAKKLGSNFKGIQSHGLLIGAFVGFLVSAKKVMQTPKDFEAWKAGVSGLISLAQGAVDLKIAYQSRVTQGMIERSRMLLQLTESDALVLARGSGSLVAGRIAGTQTLSVASKGLGVAGTLIGVYDLYVGLSQARQLQKEGALSHDVNMQLAKTGMMFLSTIAFGLIFYLGIAGIAAGIALLVLSTWFVEQQLIPKSVQMWLRRSKYGAEGEKVIGQPFRSLGEEQNALRSVLRGITVSINVGDQHTNYATDGSAMCVNPLWKAGHEACRQEVSVEREVTLKVSVPKDMKGMMSVVMGNDAGIRINNSNTMVQLPRESQDRFIAFCENNNRQSFNQSDASILSIDKKNELIKKGFEVVGDKINVKDEFRTHRVMNVHNVSIDKKALLSIEENIASIEIKRTVDLKDVSGQVSLSIDIKVFLEDQELNDVFRINLH